MVSLDESQKKFIQAAEGNIRLLAPAGCGKTLCLLHRCKYLAEQDPSINQRFLVVTFTRAAREELRSRISEDRQFSGIRDQTEITTLNSWGFRRVKNASDYPKLITKRDDYHFAMLNQLQPVWRRHERIKVAIQHTNRWKKSQAPRKLMDMIDSLKSLGFDHVRHDDFPAFAKQWQELEWQGLGWRLTEQVRELIRFDVLDEPVEEVVPDKVQRKVFDSFYVFWCEATKHLIDSATFTLEDQKYFAYQVEQNSIDKGRRLSGAASYDHVFVDEFQDINPLDLALVRAIVERNRASLTIAGDDDQAIFEWRGATPEYILKPERHFASKYVTFPLEVNYRSPENIVELSQRLIANNQRRVPKKVAAYSSSLARIEIQKVSSLTESLDYVHNLVTSSIAHGTSPSKIALVGRKRSQIIPYQVFFASREIDIPFCAAEDLQIFLSETFDRLLGLLDIKAIAQDRQRPGQVIQKILLLCDFIKRYPLSKRDKEKVRKYLQGIRTFSISEGVDALADYRGDLKGKNKNGETSLEMADAIRTFINAKSVSNTLDSLSSKFEGLQWDLGKAEEDIFFVDPPFAQLAEYARRYDTRYDAFVEDIELAKETLVYRPPFEEDGRGEDLSKNPVHLMTALRAKGKEFERVVLLDVQDGVWPNRNARTPLELEAERRVFYVAFTRAREQVTLLLNNGTVPSPYLEEMGLQAG